MADEPPELHEATEAVVRFAAAWTEWERQMAAIPDSGNDPRMQAARANLIQTHCTGKKRAYVDGLLSYSRPPTYENVTEDNLLNAELVSPTRAHVDAKGLLSFYRFVVVNKRDGWRIDSLKWRVSTEDSWEKGLIGS